MNSLNTINKVNSCGNRMTMNRPSIGQEEEDSVNNDQDYSSRNNEFGFSYKNSTQERDRLNQEIIIHVR